MRKKDTLLAMTLVLIIGFVSISQAQGCGKQRPFMKNKLLYEGLTEEQQEQIKKLRTELDKEIIPLRGEIDIKQAELKKLLVADNPNKGAVDKKVDEIFI